MTINLNLMIQVSSFFLSYRHILFPPSFSHFSPFFLQPLSTHRCPAPPPHLRQGRIGYALLELRADGQCRASSDIDHPTASCPTRRRLTPPPPLIGPTDHLHCSGRRRHRRRPRRSPPSSVGPPLPALLLRLAVSSYPLQPPNPSLETLTSLNFTGVG